MDRLKQKTILKSQRQHRVRTHLKSSSNRPRLSVNISLKHVSAQIIDDSNGQTLAYVSSRSAKLDGPLSLKAAWVGEQIAKIAKSAKIKKVSFDRGDHLFHTRLRALAEAARKSGLEF